MVQRMVEDGIVSGASWGICDDGGGFREYLGTQGSREPFSGRKIHEGLYYDLASLTKVVGTATRILQLFDCGRVHPDTAVSSVLERFRYRDITIGQLLLHNSGLPAEIRNKADWSRETIRDELYLTGPLYRPGERFIYSDVGFILLGHVIEALDECGLEESFHRHIFAPLKMKNTGYRISQKTELFVPTECTATRGCICGEVHDKKAYLLGDCGSAGLFSTLTDIMCFVDAWLGHSDDLFGRKWFELIWQTEVFGRSYGWSKEYGPHTLYHTGFTGTSILIDQKTRTGLVLLTNRIHPTRDNNAFLERRKELNHMFLHNLRDS